jgi:predicted phosphodiesterase
MSRKLTDDEEFIKLFREGGAPGVVKVTKQSTRSVLTRRRNLEAQYGIIIKSPNDGLQDNAPPRKARVPVEVLDGVVMVGSDAHYWQDVSTAHAAFVALAKKLKPEVVVLNGDILDGATISRHPPINWESTPSLIEEVGYCQERLSEIVKASPSARHLWTAGNHDLRFEARLASVASEFKGLPGVHLKDHFPQWQPCMSVWINDDVVVKHRFNGGLHARHNNTLKAGKTMVTGHTHQQGCTPFTDYNGTRYGIEAGTMAEPFGAQFEYAEDGPRNWVSGFVVLTFVDGNMMLPEFVRVVDVGLYEFRGKRWEVKI